MTATPGPSRLAVMPRLSISAAVCIYVDPTKCINIEIEVYWHGGHVFILVLRPQYSPFISIEIGFGNTYSVRRNIKETVKLLVNIVLPAVAS